MRLAGVENKRKHLIRIVFTAQRKEFKTSEKQLSDNKAAEDLKEIKTKETQSSFGTEQPIMRSTIDIGFQAGNRMINMTTQHALKGFKNCVI